MQEASVQKVQHPTSFKTMFFFTIIKVASMTLPGFALQMQTQQPSTFTWILLAFLFCSEFLHGFDFYHLQKKEKIPVRILVLQLLISTSFLIYLYHYSDIYLFLLCFCYSITQLLCKIMDYTYFYSFWYTLLQSLFDGLIFNFIISTDPPYYFTKKSMSFFLFSLLLSFLLHFFLQASLNKGFKQHFFLFVMILLFIGFVVNLYLQFQAEQMELKKTSLLIAEFGFLFLFFFLRKEFMHKFVTIYLINLLILATYYLPFFLH